MAGVFYKANPNLKGAGVSIQWTQEQAVEYLKCKADPIYFIRNYIKIISLDKGLVKFDLFQYQEKFIKTMEDNRMVVSMQPRQLGKTQTVAAYITWYLLFNDDKTVAILANKSKSSREIMSRIQLMVENLPKWLQQGVVEWNKGSIQFENNSKAFTGATTASGIRGMSTNLIYIDEVAIIPNTVANDFFTATYPTISSGKTTKIILTSTPLGLNHFWKIWTEAENKKNEFVPLRVNYWEHPDRDEKWAEEQRKLLGELKFRQEVLCLGGDSVVTIKLADGTIKNVTLTELETVIAHLLISDEQYIFHNTLGIEILTNKGFKPFVGLRKSICETPLSLVFSHKKIIASKDHIFINANKQIKASELKVGDVINGYELLSISEAEKQPVYDPVQVFDGNEYIADGITSHNCSFEGSAFTLISPDAIQKLTIENPIFERDNLRIYEPPFKGAEEKKTPGSYVLIADTASGIGGDSSAFSIIRIDETPYKVVATYNDPDISPLLYPNIIHRWASEYNNAYVLIEVNKSEQVPYILHNELEYENIIFVSRTPKGQYVSGGFGTQTRIGLLQDAKTKRIGCTMFKDLLEQGKLIVTDATAITEISTFIQRKKSYCADDGYKDDQVMTLVMFGWLTAQPYFKDLTNIDVRQQMYKKRLEAIQNEILPIGHFIDGKQTYEVEQWKDYHVVLN